MARRLANRVALITGGGSGGIGGAAALAFAREGARIAICDLDTARGEACLDQLRDAGADGIFLHTDVTQDNQMQAAVRQAVDRFGALHVLMCSPAGRSRRMMSSPMSILRCSTTRCGLICWARCWRAAMAFRRS